ncbi:DUF4325 domain-containing protein [Myroides sp. JBRI-B21084]|uniref:STAS-like domain-containing protein n=1 Tax=Myroides sp. JBRI-B21084 TaxID=3119977 RepID=UPI0026E47BB6|nr:DUF4325 domain-containing protein [Paenimyroides cloacae]WKW46720.1 DUF4325 domain-containing protein [Paenimyroides cloacae]
MLHLEKDVAISLSDIVDNTGANSEGFKLFSLLIKHENERVILSLDKNMGFSTSFLNSSIGQYIDRFGYENYKRKIAYKCTKKQYDIISSYINKFTQLV